jgi:hypothetical protein
MLKLFFSFLKRLSDSIHQLHREIVREQELKHHVEPETVHFDFVWFLFAI